MPTPEFILALREKIGHEELWLTGVTAVVLRDGEAGREVLLGRRADNGRVGPISGILDPGEEPAVAAEREVREEAGIVAEAESLAWVHTLAPFAYPNGDRVRFLDLVFRCRYVSGEPHPADGEASEVFWRPLERIDEVAEPRETERIRIAAESTGVTRFER